MFAIVTAGLLGIGVVLATSESVAGPIVGEESLALPPPTAQTQEMTDAVARLRPMKLRGTGPTRANGWKPG